MRTFISKDGVSVRRYCLKPRFPGRYKVFRGPFLGSTSFGNQAIGDVMFRADQTAPEDPPKPYLVVHWFNPDGDFLRFEQRQVEFQYGQIQPSELSSFLTPKMLEWMAELGVTEKAVEIKAFGSESGMYLLDPQIHVDSYDGEFDFEEAMSTGRFDLYWQEEHYIYDSGGNYAG